MTTSNLQNFERLRKFVKSRERDDLLTDTGGAIIYVIDTDIVHMYTEPKKEGSFVQKRQGYCQIFEESSKPVSENLSILLSNYLFNELSASPPLIMFKGHLKEVSRMANALANKTILQAEKIHPSIDDSIPFGLANLVAKAKGIDKNLEKMNPQIDFEEELEKLSCQLIESLNSGERIERLNHILSPTSNRITSIPKLLGENYNLIERSLLFDRNDIYERTATKLELEKHVLKRGKNKSNENIAADVDCLYSLLQINSNIKSSGKKLRFVLITGDEGLYLAASEFEWPVRSNEFPLECFLRHPLSFLNDESFLGEIEFDGKSEPRKTGKTSEKNKGKSDVNLHEFDDLASLLKAFSEEELSKLSPSDKRNTAAEMPTRFDNFYKQRNLHQSFEVNFTLGDKVKSLLYELKGTRISEETLRRVFNRANNFFINESNNLSVNLSLLKVHAEDSNFCFRVPPLLRLFEHSQAQQFVKSCVLQSEKTSKRKQFSLLESVKEKDQSEYFTTLCYAATWAVNENWDMVKKNAVRALKIAMDYSSIARKDKGYAPLGNEAAYLASVASRHLFSATNRDDFEIEFLELRALLNYAGDLWDRMSRRFTQRRIERKDTEYRLKHESFSIELMELWYEIFFFNLDDHSQEELSNIEGSLESLAHDYFTIVCDCESHLKDPSLDDFQRDYILYAIRHAINNFFLVTIVMNKHPKFKKDVVIEELQYVHELYSQTNNEKTTFRTKSFLHASVIAITNYFYFSPSKKQKTERLASLHSLLTDENIKKFSKKPYERSRFMFFKRICNILD